MPVCVLLVEDDEDDYVIVEEALGTYSSLFRLIWAQNYQDAIEQMETQEPDACLVDFGLGEKTGLDLVKQAILMDFSGPLIILTGLGYDAGIDDEAMKLGADDYLAKNEISAQLLKRTILFNIQRKRTEARMREGEARFRQIAEISSNTLHNIGNVLNNLTISGQTAENLLNQINLERLADVAKMLETFSQVQQDAKGKLISPYLLKVKENLGEGVQEVATAIQSSLKKLQMAREAISIQHKTMRSGKKEWFSLAGLVQEAFSLHRVHITRKEIAYTIDDPHNCKAYFHRTTLLHIMINLVKNAIEATYRSQERKIHVVIDKKDESIELSFTDTGMGITAEAKEKLFSHGFTTKHDGNGFGLNFCRHALEKEGGKISAESEGEGKGACFKITLRT